MSVLLEFSIWPMDKGESVGQYVARSLQIVDASGLDYRLGPMGTSLEADDWDRALDVVRQCFEQMRQDCRRIACSIHVDYRLGPTGRLAGKVESLERRLGRPLKK